MCTWTRRYSRQVYRRDHRVLPAGSGRALPRFIVRTPLWNSVAWVTLDVPKMAARSDRHRYILLMSPKSSAARPPPFSKRAPGEAVCTASSSGARLWTTRSCTAPSIRAARPMIYRSPPATRSGCSVRPRRGSMACAASRIETPHEATIAAGRRCGRHPSPRAVAASLSSSGPFRTELRSGCHRGCRGPCRRPIRALPRSLRCYPA